MKDVVLMCLMWVERNGVVYLLRVGEEMCLVLVV